jgi:hypothetical protein
MTARPHDRAIALHTLRASPTVEAELEWFFTMAESSMGCRSNFAEAAARVRPTEDPPSAEDDAEAARHRARVRALLHAIPSKHAGVLQTAYEPRPWPLGLRDELGRLTGIVVRLACSEMGIPGDGQRVEMLLASELERRRTAEPADDRTAKLRHRAERLFGAALRAYGREREGRTRAKAGPAKPPPNIPLRALYKIPELAHFFGVHRHRMRRMLDKCGVQLLRSGRTIYVPLAQIEKRVQPIWQSIVAAEMLRHA